MLVSVILPLNLPWTPVYKVPEGMSLAVGDRVSVPCAGKQYTGVVSGTGVTSTLDEKQIHSVTAREDDLPAVSEKEIELWKFLSEYYMCPLGDVYKTAYPSVRLKGEMVAARKKEVHQGNAAFEGESPTLSEAQQRAAAECEAAFAEGVPALLKGITGSGKTEIYLSFAAQVLRGGGKVLMLVPEIALSRQLEERLGKVFGGNLYTYHSSMTPLKRRKVAAAVRAEGPCIVLGTRSALFLPFDTLGLVVVDEEHDTSYKSDSSPRYNGRDTAVMLARIHGCPLLLGSATPSLESMYNALKGLYKLVELRERYFEGQDAEVEVIDTIAEKRKRGMVGSLSRKLIAHIQDTLDAHKQVVVLRARRAYSTVLQCSGCGEILKCPHCNVPMALHNDGKLHCHYCGSVGTGAFACPKCGGELVAFGNGTQKIEEELRAVFPAASVDRLDSDTGDDAGVVARFAAGETDILVGTQMVTKGFDFEGLALVAVIGADGLLAQQDFRADERALQLLEQFRGRTGRRGQRGLFVIQTAQSAHPVFAQLRSAPVHSGTAAPAPDVSPALAERKAFGYPPFTRLITIILKDKSEARLQYMASILASEVSRDTAGSRLEGPYAPAIDKLADNHIRHIRLVLPRDSRLAATKRSILQTISNFEKARKYPGHIVIDVDPV